jgi:hypothetical protein
MQAENDYDKDVYNGDLGIVSSIDIEKPNSSPTSMAAKSRTALANWMGWCSPYATTIHKSQGSEYPAVVIPLTTQHYPMLQRNLAPKRKVPQLARANWVCLSPMRRNAQSST